MINWFNMKKKTLPCQVLENKEDIEKLKGYVQEAYKTTEELTSQTTSVALNTTNIGEAENAGWLISPNGLLFKIVGIVEGVVNILFYADILGPTGPANTLNIGSVVSGEQASASITGTAPNQTLNLILPRGERGERGLQGPQGERGFTGATGPVGPQGEQGIRGEKGDGFNFMGSWVSGNEYYKDDVVTYQLGENQVASYVLIAESLIGSTTPPNQDSSNWKILVSAPKSSNELILNPNMNIFSNTFDLAERQFGDERLKEFRNLPYGATLGYTNFPEALTLYNYLKSAIKLDGRPYGVVISNGLSSNLGIMQGRGVGTSSRIEIRVHEESASQTNDYYIEFNDNSIKFLSSSYIIPFSSLAPFKLISITGALAEEPKLNLSGLNIDIIESSTFSSNTRSTGRMNSVNYPLKSVITDSQLRATLDGLNLEANKIYKCDLQVGTYPYKFLNLVKSKDTPTASSKYIIYIDAPIASYNELDNWGGSFYLGTNGESEKTIYSVANITQAIITKIYE